VRPGRDADHTPPSRVKKELRYTSTHPMGPPGPVTGFPLPFFSFLKSKEKLFCFNYHIFDVSLSQLHTESNFDITADRL
jgi:hypothetical protein